MFREKVCFVTGGARGIGKAIIHVLLKQGAKCFFVDILYDAGLATETEFADEFGTERIAFHRADVSSDTNLRQAFKACLSKFGTLDIVVNNAGIMNENAWETAVQTNFTAPIRGCKMAVEFMAKDGIEGESTRQGGMVINISSAQGLFSWPGMPVYSASKAGLIGFTRCAGHTLEHEHHGVQIMALCPFAVDTAIGESLPYSGMTKAGHEVLGQVDMSGDTILKPDDVGRGVIYILTKGHPGSVWFIHQRGERPFEIPNQHELEAVLKFKPGTA